jgi:hypothetical protein
MAKHQQHQYHDGHYSQQRDDHLHFTHLCKRHRNASVHSYPGSTILKQISVVTAFIDWKYVL